MRYFYIDIFVRRPTAGAAAENLFPYPAPPWSVRWGDHAVSAEAACELALDWFRSANPSVCVAGYEITAKPLRPDGFKAS